MKPKKELKIRRFLIPRIFIFVCVLFGILLENINDSLNPFLYIGLAGIGFMVLFIIYDLIGNWERKS